MQAGSLHPRVWFEPWRRSNAVEPEIEAVLVFSYVEQWLPPSSSAQAHDAAQINQRVYCALWEILSSSRIIIIHSPAPWTMLGWQWSHLSANAYNATGLFQQEIMYSCICVFFTLIIYSYQLFDWWLIKQKINKKKRKSAFWIGIWMLDFQDPDPLPAPSFFLFFAFVGLDIPPWWWSSWCWFRLHYSPWTSFAHPRIPLKHPTTPAPELWTPPTWPLASVGDGKKVLGSNRIWIFLELGWLYCNHKLMRPYQND